MRVFRPTAGPSKLKTTASGGKSTSGASKPIAPQPERPRNQDLGGLPDELLNKFILSGEHAKSYTQQYANVYFTRLAKLKKVVRERAARKWDDMSGAF